MGGPQFEEKKGGKETAPTGIVPEKSEKKNKKGCQKGSFPPMRGSGYSNLPRRRDLAKTKEKKKQEMGEGDQTSSQPYRDCSAKSGQTKWIGQGRREFTQRERRLDLKEPAIQEKAKRLPILLLAKSTRGLRMSKEGTPP